MEGIKVKEIVEATKGQLLCGDPETMIDHVCIDSREVKNGSLFVPIIGERVDAHRFIGSVFESGAAATFTSKGEILDQTKPHILVENTEKALGALGVYYKAKYPIPVIGVTGSVGKTSTKEMIAAALSTKYNVLKTAGNQNSNIGVPLTLFRIEKQHEIAVIEMGISDFDEMSELADYVHPDVAVVTNIGVAHLAQFKCKENTMAQKLQIAKHFDADHILYVNADNDMLHKLYTKEAISVELPELKGQLKFFGTDDKLDYYAKNIHIKDGKQCFTFVCQGYEEEVSMLQLGLHTVYNGVVALAIALHYGIEPSVAKAGIEAYEGIAMRQQVNHMKDGIKIIDDTYNASPDSICSCIDVLVSMDNTGKKIASLADVLELGDQSWECHYETGCKIANAGIDVVVTVGEMMKGLIKGINDTNSHVKTYAFETNEEAAAYILGILMPEDAVICKGSRGMHQEEVVAYLKNNLA